MVGRPRRLRVQHLGWKKAAIVGDDYSFPYTSLAGFVAEYCAIGGNITKRVWAPLGEEDYSSYISQIPEDVDGLYVGIGGSGLINFLKQYKQQRGKIDTEKMMGNVFWDDPLVLKEVGKDLVGGVTSAMTAADSTDPAVKSYIEDMKTNYGDEIAGAARPCSRTATTRPAEALVKALNEVNGDISDQKALQDALSATTLSGDEAPWGDVKLDDNRQAISNVFVKKIVADKTGDGVPDVQTLARIPDVDQTFGGVLQRRHAGAGPREPEVREGHAPAMGGQRREGRLRLGVMAAPATSAEGAAPILRLRGVGRRFGGVVAVSGVDLDVRAGERRAILGPNGAGKTTLFNLISGEFPPTAGSVELFGGDVTALPARKRARMGLSRTFQTSRLFGGLSVDDNLYLAVLGVHDGHFRLLKKAADDEMRERGRAMAAAVGLSDKLDDLVAELSHGEQRQLEVGMARAADPQLMMLDEPAAGLSRAERVKLTELLLALDPAITLILIEHDMDVALRVAEWVTMMHDGRVIVEGTPDEIRANELVHDLYLGSAHH